MKPNQITLLIIAIIIVVAIIIFFAYQNKVKTKKAYALASERRSVLKKDVELMLNVTPGMTRHELIAMSTDDLAKLIDDYCEKEGGSSSEGTSLHLAGAWKHHIEDPGWTTDKYINNIIRWYIEHDFGIKMADKIAPYMS